MYQPTSETYHKNVIQQVVDPLRLDVRVVVRCTLTMWDPSWQDRGVYHEISARTMARWKSFASRLWHKKQFVLIKQMTFVATPASHMSMIIGLSRLQTAAWFLGVSEWMCGGSLQINMFPSCPAHRSVHGTQLWQSRLRYETGQWEIAGQTWGRWDDYRIQQDRMCDSHED